MPRPPPRPLCLPDLVKNPQARAEYIQSHPPVHGLSSPYASSSHSDTSRYSNAPPSPSSTDVNSHRASATTLASLNSPVTPASTHTSLSVHNSPWLSDIGKRASGSGGGLMPVVGGAEEEPESRKLRASWSSALANTKSWFGGPVAAENKDPPVTAVKKSNSKEIKLSPSMIAAYAATAPPPPRPVSSPYPSASEPPPLSPTGSTISSCRTPRVGSGLRYYTDHNPAPTQARVQIPDPIDSQDHDRPRPALAPNNHDPSAPTPTLTTFAGLLKRLPTSVTLNSALDAAGSKDNAKMTGEETRGPPSPPPTPPANVRDSDVPDIRISSGDDL